MVLKIRLYLHFISSFTSKPSIMEKTIWLVIEQGAGTIHKAFESKDDAIVFADILKITEGMECFEVKPVDYHY